jgi:hypothetical protein
MPQGTADDADVLLARWRDQVRSRNAPGAAELAALEARLGAEAAALAALGLAREEALLLAIRRLGEREPAFADAARAQVEAAVWNRSRFAAGRPLLDGNAAWREARVAFGLATLAALAFKLPALLGFGLEEHEGFYLRSFSLFVLPFLAAYFVWKRGATPVARIGLTAAFAAALLLVNLLPIPPRGQLEGVVVLHLPVALWLAVGIAYAGGRWQEVAARMDFVRFSGELGIYYVLIALGGGVFMAFTFALFHSLGLDPGRFFERWLLPCGALGAVIVAAWLVETRQGLAGSLAPLLTRIFTPLFVLLLLAFLVTMSWTGRGPEFHRDLLIAFDLLLAVVVGLLLYSIAGRDSRPPGWFDRLSILLVLAALAVDGAALWAIAGRILELGLTPNRAAALGENLILLANLAGSAVLYLRFVRGRGTFAALERWQTGFLPVYAAWAAFVVLVFPFGFGVGPAL